MSGSLRSAVAGYLSLRRSLGYQLEYHGHALPAFVAYLAEAGLDHVSTEAALAWATLPSGAHPAWWRSRLGVVRDFARYLQTIDPATEIPPRDLLTARRDRLSPHWFSDTELAGLMRGARALVPEWKAHTFETLVGLLASTGLRLGEALSLDCTDVDLEAGVAVVARAKAYGAREVALHPSTCEALRHYLEARAERWPNPATTALFISARGARLPASSVHPTFRGLSDQVCTLRPGERRRPRLHDLRHRFAMRTLMDWYRQGLDVGARLPLLSTHLGHSGPAATFWYLEAVPELMGAVANRLEGVLGAQAMQP
jgi:integrase